jgi:hypothetical protein
MASLRHERRIHASAASVWGVVHRPETIPDWFPGIVSCTVEGSTRTITTEMGLTLSEEIIANDPLQRRFAYRITTPLVRNHLGTIDVIELGPEESLCVYSTTAEPDAFALMIAGGTYGALEEIARRAEAGV